MTEVLGDPPEGGVCPKCGKEWDVYHQLERILMPVLTSGSVLCLITGDKGSGKTWFSQWLECALVKMPHTDWHCISNVVYGTFKGMRNHQPQDDPEAIPEYDRLVSPHEKVHFANTLADAFRIESELMWAAYQRGRRIHVFMVLDEGPVTGLGSLATQTSIYEERSQNLYKTITLSRKISTSLCIIGISEKLLSPKLRSAEDVGGIGLCRVVFSKWANDIEAVAQQSRDDGRYDHPYDIDGIPTKELVAVFVKDDPNFLPSLLAVGTSSFTRRTEDLKPGETNYDSFSIAGFTTGEIGGEPFSLDDLIVQLSDLHSSEIPEAMYRYFHPGEQESSGGQRDGVQNEPDDAQQGGTRAGPSEPERDKTVDAEIQERATPAFQRLQAEVAKDRVSLQRFGKVRYPTLADLYRAAKVSEKTFYRMKHRLDLRYRFDVQGEDGSDA
ncbi:MAG TPA: hypothetical protein VEY12_04915 [Thermoplasmata archaeon]|nr:hypothetical protein [Thermoplasmata archaeon]